MAIQLYGFWRSNAAFRVRVALALKELAYEEIGVDILSGEQFGPDYAAVNPAPVVPTLVHDGHPVFQSLAIIEYLEEVYPAPRLLPIDPRERAYARSLAAICVSDAHPLTVPRVRKYLGEVFSVDPAAIERWCRHWTREGLVAYERSLTRRPAKPFVLGSETSIADICIAGQVALADVYRMDVSDFPKVADLAKRCFALPAFLAAHPFAHSGYRAGST